MTSSAAAVGSILLPFQDVEFERTWLRELIPGPDGRPGSARATSSVKALRLESI